MATSERVFSAASEVSTDQRDFDLIEDRVRSEAEMMRAFALAHLQGDDTVASDALWAKSLDFILGSISALPVGSLADLDAAALPPSLSDGLDGSVHLTWAHGSRRLLLTISDVEGEGAVYSIIDTESDIDYVSGECNPSHPNPSLLTWMLQ